jgi:hypothetical protein
MDCAPCASAPHDSKIANIDSEIEKPRRGGVSPYYSYISASAALIALLTGLAVVLLMLLAWLLSAALLLAGLFVFVPIVTAATLLLIRFRIALLLLLIRIAVRILLVHDVIILLRLPRQLENARKHVSFRAGGHWIHGETAPNLSREPLPIRMHFPQTFGECGMEWYLLLVLLLLGMQIPVFVLIWLLRDLRSK